VDSVAYAAPPVQYRVGGMIVTKIPERNVTMPARTLLPDWRPAALAADAAWPGNVHVDADRATLTISVHAWLVQGAGKVVLIDAGIGNGKTRAASMFDRLDTPFLGHMAALGVTPGDVTHVLNTHIHTDHVGWNTRLEHGSWVPTFPNARYVLPRAGYAYFSSRGGSAKPNYDMFADSVLPVIEAGQASFIGPSGGNPVEGFAYLPTPGHSVDHQSILLRSGGDQALFGGDVVHHPLQLLHPDWRSAFCAAPGQALASRRWALNYAAAQHTLFLSSHFAGSSAGIVSRQGNAYQWQFL
jgi:glyoxylase-like metal-dependent hydrolase (beta-lactamase superfamily II)